MLISFWWSLQLLFSLCVTLWLFVVEVVGAVVYRVYIKKYVHFGESIICWVMPVGMILLISTVNYIECI